MPGPSLSVLMAVYTGTPAQHLDVALDSVLNQTRPANQVVLVVDGAISPRHDAVLTAYLGRITRLDLTHNVGLGRALRRASPAVPETGSHARTQMMSTDRTA